jgi:hypothetical protein
MADESAEISNLNRPDYTRESSLGWTYSPLTSDRAIAPACVSANSSSGSSHYVDAAVSACPVAAAMIDSSVAASRGMSATIRPSRITRMR